MNKIKVVVYTDRFRYSFDFSNGEVKVFSYEDFTSYIYNKPLPEDFFETHARTDDFTSKGEKAFEEIIKIFNET